MLHKCGFCQGTGEVRRSLTSRSIVCQVCSGRGTIRIEEPVAACTFCRGTGRDPYKYPQALVTCPICLGKGIVTSTKSNIQPSHAGEKGDTGEQESNAALFKYPMSRFRKNKRSDAVRSI
jgi:DnaJ-class molecular chaperone